MKKQIYAALFALFSGVSLEAVKIIGDLTNGTVGRDNHTVQRARQALAEVHKEWDRRQIGTKPHDEEAEKRLERKEYVLCNSMRLRMDGWTNEDVSRYVFDGTWPGEKGQSVRINPVDPLTELLLPFYARLGTFIRADAIRYTTDVTLIMLSEILDLYGQLEYQNSTQRIPLDQNQPIIDIFLAPLLLEGGDISNRDNYREQFTRTGIFSKSKANSTVATAELSALAVNNMLERLRSLWAKPHLEPGKPLTREEKTEIINIFLSPFSVTEVTVSDSASPKFYLKFDVAKFAQDLQSIINEQQGMIRKMRDLTNDALQNSSKQPTADEAQAGFQELEASGELESALNWGNQRNVDHVN